MLTLGLLPGKEIKATFKQTLINSEEAFINTLFGELERGKKCGFITY